jgi:voltage-gated potassium channel
MGKKDFLDDIIDDLKGLKKGFRDNLKRISIGFLALLVLLIIGSTVLSVWQGVGFGDALKEAAVKVFYPKTADAKEGNFFLGIFYLIIAFLSIGIIYYISENIINLLLKSDFKEVLGMVKIANMKNHVILCGGGAVGGHAARELHEEGTEFVIVEKDPTIVRLLRRKGFFVIEGDCQNDDVLKKAGISKCKGVVISLSDSGDALFIILSVKQLNPEALIASRANSVTTMKKMKQAGADYIVMPELEGANRLVEFVSRKNK